MSEFTGQVAVITGAASGIGLAIAKKLLNEDAHVALMDINKHAMDHEFQKYHPQARIIEIDVTSQSQVQRAIDGVVDDLGRIDILVNSAGITGITNTMSHEVCVQDLNKVFALNFMSCFYTSKAALPHMLTRSYGRVLHLASIAGKDGNAGMLAYSCSKAAVVGMTKVQGKEYAQTGITINAMAPAVIRTPLVDAMPEEQVKYMTDKIPMKRCGTLQEAADLAAYIISAKNSFTTGFTFDLTGGRATY